MSMNFLLNAKKSLNELNSLSEKYFTLKPAYKWVYELTEGRGYVRSPEGLYLFHFLYRKNEKSIYITNIGFSFLSLQDDEKVKESDLINNVSFYNSNFKNIQNSLIL